MIPAAPHSNSCHYSCHYRGRFAPSPSGPLHHGSLLIALASYLDAKANNGEWLVRIEDIDELRTVDGSEFQILKALEAHGLHWDEKPANQSLRKSRYREALDQLAENQNIFSCNCPRKKLREIGGPYPGYCREKLLNTAGAIDSVCDAAIRFNTFNLIHQEWQFQDRVQGQQGFDMATLGDFVVKRRDGLFAYQLAVVVDDQDQEISHIVRGTDLLESTPWQMAIQQALEYRSCDYAHLPILTREGIKLSKQTGATGIQHENEDACRRNLLWALEVLGQKTVPGLEQDNSMPDYPDASECCESILNFARDHWLPSRIPTTLNLPVTGLLP